MQLVLSVHNVGPQGALSLVRFFGLQTVCYFVLLGVRKITWLDVGPSFSGRLVFVLSLTRILQRDS